MNVVRPRLLTRDVFDSLDPAPRARIAHFGLGSFHRAHQAWYTAHSHDGPAWGICAFTGRGAGLAATLRRQGGLYTLIERSATGDRFEVMTNLVEIHEGADSGAIIDVVSRPEIVVITTTVTEAGYRLHLDGTPRTDDAELDQDVATLQHATREALLGAPPLNTVPGRLLLGLEARRRSDVGPLTIVPCDNLPRNGWVVEQGLRQLAKMVSPLLTTWMNENVAFASSSVDRITPRTSSSDLDTVTHAMRWLDFAPVVTEPFASWVVSGNFAAQRPRWETAGVLFVEDVEPYEKRKLWLLNGAHSLLALLGLDIGHETVAEAISDPACRDWIESFWASARHHLPEHLEIDTYCAQLIERFENARIKYELEQIAADSVMKLRTRIAPVILAELRAGRTCDAGTQILATWIVRVRTHGSFRDAEHLAVTSITETSASPTSDLVGLVDVGLRDFTTFIAGVEHLVNERLVAQLATQKPSTTRRD
jgi:fructuronate reductase